MLGGRSGCRSSLRQEWFPYVVHSWVVKGAAVQRLIGRASLGMRLLSRAMYAWRESMRWRRERRLARPPSAVPASRCTACAHVSSNCDPPPLFLLAGIASSHIDATRRSSRPPKQPHGRFHLCCKVWSGSVVPAQAGRQITRTPREPQFTGGGGGVAPGCPRRASSLCISNPSLL